jgi:hypothetical protein
MNTLRLLMLFAGYLVAIPLTAQNDPRATEAWSPVPKVVTPGKTCTAPSSDAIVLFDGSNLDKWQKKDGGRPEWALGKDGSVTITKNSGDLATIDSFGSCQLHIEFREPARIEGDGQGRGNSGIFLMGQYEVQVLDSYQNPTYTNGQAGSIYKQAVPLVNASRKPGEWQSFDIIFTAPVFRPDHSLASPARITVLHNNLVIQNNVEITGSTVYTGKPVYTDHGSRAPLVLQNHGNAVSFRNIWIRRM